MLRRTLMLVVLMLSTCTLFVNGCGSDEGDTDVEVKTAEQYKAEADKEIDKANLQDELEKLEKEIDSDTPAE